MNNTIYICIPVHNRIEYTLKCLQSIEGQEYKNCKVVVCDDGSTDNTKEIIKTRYPFITILEGNGHLWWAGAINVCVNYVLKNAKNDDYIFTLNNDTELLPNTITNLVKRSKRYPGSIIGAVNLFFSSPQKIEPSAFCKCGRGIFQNFYNRLDEWGAELENRNEIVKADSLSGKGVLFPIKVFQTCGLYNSQLLPHYHADTEFIIRAKRNMFRVYLDYNSRLLSHQELSGIGTRTSKPRFKSFLSSFSNIKSTHHYQSLKNKNKLIYGHKYRTYLILNVLLIVLGFIKRYFLFFVRRLLSGAQGIVFTLLNHR